MRIRMILLAFVVFGVVGLGASGSVAASQANVPFLSSLCPPGSSMRAAWER